MSDNESDEVIEVDEPESMEVDVAFIPWYLLGPRDAWDVSTCPEPTFFWNGSFRMV